MRIKDEQLKMGMDLRRYAQMRFKRAIEKGTGDYELWKKKMQEAKEKTLARLSTLRGRKAWQRARQTAGN